MFNLSYASFAGAYHGYAGLDKETLFASLGWSGLDSSSGHVRNGAVLTSLALLTAGAPLHGSLPVLAGPLAGSKVLSGANRLADWLAIHFAEPEILDLGLGMTGLTDQLFGQRGILAFIQGSGPQGGSIALLDRNNAGALWVAAEGKHPLAARFWPLY